MTTSSKRLRSPLRPVLGLLALLLVAALCGRAHAGDPELLWRSIESEHFRITYHEPLGPVAQRLAKVGERAHAMLSPFFQHSPRFRTEVLLTDNTDSSNGSAITTPFPTVRLFLTAPSDRFELIDFDDWLLDLFVHEYTHILHLDTVNGVHKWVNYILGFGVNTLYAPNQLQTTWFIEGLAVVEETMRTSSGRLRSSQFEMYLRAHTLEGRFLRLDQVSSGTMLFPRGNVPYLYGSAFLQYIAKRFGPQILSQVSQRYGGCWSPDCWVPLGMNRTLRRFTGGLGYDALYKDFRRELEQRFLRQKEAIEHAPLGRTLETPLSTWKEDLDRPVFGPDGHELLWIESDPYRRPALMRRDLVTGKTQVELNIDGADGLALAPDGKSAVMSRLNYFRGNYTFQDLVLYRRDRKTLVGLTDGLRADNPAISPDGRLIAFEVNSAGTKRLGLMELPDTRDAGSEDRIDKRAVQVPEVWQARAARPVSFPLPQQPFSQVYTPAFSPDGKQIAFSYWQEGGYRDIVTLDLETRRLHYITRDRALDLEPRYSPDGEFLYFVSDRSGVYNVYAHHLKTDTLWQVTNVVNGLFSPAVSLDGKLLACVGFVAEGYRFESIALDPSRFVLAPASIIERPEPPEVPKPDLTPEGRLPVHVYNPARTFFRTPFSLLSLQLPISAPGPYGQAFGFQFSTTDLVGLHRLSLGLTLNSGRLDATGASASYTYSRLWNPISLTVARSLSPRNGLVLNGQAKSYDEEQWSGSISTSLPVLVQPARSASISVSYGLSYTRNTTPVPAPGPDDLSPILPEVGRFGALRLGFSYNDARSYLYSVAPEAGRSLSVSTAFSHAALGSQYLVYSLQVTAVQYFGIPWPWRWAKNHSLSLSYNGAIGGGDLQRRGLFYLGGYTSGDDLLRTLIGQGATLGRLRGYTSNAAYGDQLHLFSVDYRFPIVWLERGYETLPLYLWRLSGGVYSDAGAVFFGNISWDKFKVGVGGELKLEGRLGYALPISIQVGYAHGFMDGADSRFYILFNNPIGQFLPI